MTVISVVVVDDHDLVRMGITRMLTDHPDIEVIGEASDGESALLKTKALKPDVVLLDVNLPNISGVEVTKRLKNHADQHKCTLKILAVSSFVSQPYPAMLLKAGVDGYITKGTDFVDMVQAIKKVHAGGKYFSHDIAEQLADMLTNDGDVSPFDRLSEREKQVAMLIVNCHSPQEIADQLFVSVKTINTYRYRIYDKLGVDSDVKLTHLAMRHKLIEP